MRTNKPTTITLTDKEIEIFDWLQDETGESRSQIIRWSIQAYVRDDSRAARRVSGHELVGMELNEKSN